MSRQNPWVWTLTVLVITGLVASIAILVANQHQTLGEIIKARPVAILFGTAFICLLGGALILWRRLEDSEFESDSERRERKEREEREFDVVKIIIVTTIAVVVGWYLITVASAYADKEMQEVAVRVATGWAMAYFSGAFLVGFLFGIPKVIEGNGEKQGSGKTGGSVADQESSSQPDYQQRVNTNLEQISDWLTKIIVGLGLVELRNMPGYLHRAATWMATSISCKTNCESEQAASFCCAFIIFFSAVGFLAGYLLTRLFLAQALRRAENYLPPKKGAVQQIVFASKKTSSAVVGSVVDDKANAENAEKIRKFWKPENKIDHDTDQKLKRWLQKKRLDVSIPMFILGAQYAQERDEFIKEELEEKKD